MKLEIPEDFYREEIRNDFLITSEMKHYWASELRILSVIDDICQKHHIKYFAYYGTLLGAIRHKGFVPWDDDIDLAFLREDYDRFLQVVSSELPDKLYFRSFWNSDRLKIFPEISNGNSFSDLGRIDLDYFCGCPYISSIDICPIDWMPDDPESQNLQTSLLYLAVVALMAWQQKGFSVEDRVSIIKKINQTMGVEIDISKNVIRQLYALGDSIIAMYGANDGCSRAGTLYKRFYGNVSADFSIPRECFESVVYQPFEFIEIPVPVGYDAVLTRHYGDYMTMKQGLSSHDYPVFLKQKEYLDDKLK
ncbi:MAG: phosphorylcholine transferase LicD [Candidatus Weimeria sp.]